MPHSASAGACCARPGVFPDLTQAVEFRSVKTASAFCTFMSRLGWQMSRLERPRRASGPPLVSFGIRVVTAAEGPLAGAKWRFLRRIPPRDQLLSRPNLARPPPGGTGGLATPRPGLPRACTTRPLHTRETRLSWFGGSSRFVYSYRRASIGSRADARIAGTRPNTMPTVAENPIPRANDHQGSEIGKLVA